MMTSSPLIWKRHKHRENFNFCPHCEKPLKWIYDGDQWLPCDDEPVLFSMHPEGKLTIVFEKKVLENCLLYKRGDKRCAGSPLWGYQQHYFTCEWLKERRKNYIKELRK